MGKGARNRARVFDTDHGSGVVTGSDMGYTAQPKAIQDPGLGKHLWIAYSIHHVADPEAVTKGRRQQMMDMENLLTVNGPVCFKCEEPYSFELAKKPCNGSMD